MSSLIQPLSTGFQALYSSCDFAASYSHVRNNLGSAIHAVASHIFAANSSVPAVPALSSRTVGVASSSVLGSLGTVALGAFCGFSILSLANNITRGVVRMLGPPVQTTERVPPVQPMCARDWAIMSLALPIITAGDIVYLAMNTLFLAPLWIDGDGMSASKKLLDLARILGRLVSRPLALIAYECAAITGVFHPALGRKFFGKICYICGEPWCSHFPNLPTIENNLEQYQLSLLTREDLFNAAIALLCSSPNDAKLRLSNGILLQGHEDIKKLLTKMTEAYWRRKVVVNGTPHDVTSISCSIMEYIAKELLRITNPERSFPQPSTFLPIEEQAFLQWLKKREEKKFLCPISGSFLRHPVHHRERANLVVEKEALDAARSQGLDAVTLVSESLPFASFQEEPIREEVVQQEILSTRLHAMYALEQEISSLYLALSHPEILQRIPRMVWGDPQIDDFHCVITGEPIRFVVSPNNSLGACYEETSLRTWLQTTPNVLPPRWPADVPFDETHIQICQTFQGTIDERLRQIAAEITAAHLVQT